MKVDIFDKDTHVNNYNISRQEYCTVDNVVIGKAVKVVKIESVTSTLNNWLHGARVWSVSCFM
jgi:hypothetical protein